MYRGIIPATVGAASGHGFRTATYEVACKLLAPLTLMPLITEIQIQGFGSGLGTLVGTTVRIPCEVLKQRLQTGQHDNAIEAFKAVTKNGPRGLFAGTAATLSREVPFYVIGLVAYEKLKKAAAIEEAEREARLRAEFEAAIPEEVTTKVESSLAAAMEAMKEQLEERFAAQEEALLAKIAALEAK